VKPSETAATVRSMRNFFMRGKSEWK